MLFSLKDWHIILTILIFVWTLIILIQYARKNFEKYDEDYRQMKKALDELTLVGASQNFRSYSENQDNIDNSYTIENTSGENNVFNELRTFYNDNLKYHTDTKKKMTDFENNNLFNEEDYEKSEEKNEVDSATEFLNEGKNNIELQYHENTTA